MSEELLLWFSKFQSTALSSILYFTVDGGIHVIISFFLLLLFFIIAAEIDQISAVVPAYLTRVVPRGFDVAQEVPRVSKRRQSRMLKIRIASELVDDASSAVADETGSARARHAHARSLALSVV